MGKLIKTFEIDEFNNMAVIPAAAISQEIIDNIKDLNEKTEIEPFIREIIYDPNETPHGPTEIADIISSVNLRGSKTLTAFVIKGKSFGNVKSTDVAHQFMKLQTFPGLGLLIFVAVGNIHDDAYRDFIQTADNYDCDYLVIDAHELSKLFIAYDKVCPKDGLPFGETGGCSNGHIKDIGITLEMKVNEKIAYSISSQRDISHLGAKRYSAILLIDKHYTKEIIRIIIKEATMYFTQSKYHRNASLEAIWANFLAQVIWLYIANDVDDINNSNWICRTLWIDQDLREDMRPMKAEGHERIDDIEIYWNDEYETLKAFYEKHKGSKGEYLKLVSDILLNIRQFAEKGISLFKLYSEGEITEEIFIRNIQKLEPTVNDLYDRAGNLLFPPEECNDYDDACQSTIAIIANLFLYYSPKGLKRWPKEDRAKLFEMDIGNYLEEIAKLNHEKRKIH